MHGLFIPDYPGLSLETTQHICVGGRFIKYEIINKFIVHPVAFKHSKQHLICNISERKHSILP